MIIRRAFIITLLCFLILPATARAHYEGELLPDSVAEMEYRMIISMAPKDTLTMNKLGMVYLRQGKFDKAKAQFLDIIKVDPKNFDALDSLGMTAEKSGDYKKAVEWYGKALSVKDDDGLKRRMGAAAQRLKGR